MQASARITVFERDEYYSQQVEPGTCVQLFVHHSCIVMDIIKHFKNENVMNCQLTFQVISERGQGKPKVEYM